MKSDKETYRFKVGDRVVYFDSSIEKYGTSIYTISEISSDGQYLSFTKWIGSNHASCYHLVTNKGKITSLH